MAKISQTAKIFLIAALLCSAVSLLIIFILRPTSNLLEAFAIIIFITVVFVGAFMTYYMYLKLFKKIFRRK